MIKPKFIQILVYDSNVSQTLCNITIIIEGLYTHRLVTAAENNYKSF